MFQAVHVADGAEAARIFLSWMFVYAFGTAVIYTILAFKNGKDVR